MLNIAQPSKSTTPAVNTNALKRKEKYSFTAKKNRKNNRDHFGSGSQFLPFDNSILPKK